MKKKYARFNQRESTHQGDLGIKRINVTNTFLITCWVTVKLATDYSKWKPTCPGGGQAPMPKRLSQISLKKERKKRKKQITFRWTRAIHEQRQRPGPVRVAQPADGRHSVGGTTGPPNAGRRGLPGLPLPSGSNGVQEGRKPCSTPHSYKLYWPPAPGRTPNTGKTQTGRKLVLVALRSARPLALVTVLVPRHRGASSSTPPWGERNSGPQRWVYPEPQNAVLSGINVLVDTVKALRMRSSGSGWGLNPRTSVLIRETKI